MDKQFKLILNQLIKDILKNLVNLNKIQDKNGYSNRNILKQIKI